MKVQVASYSIWVEKRHEADWYDWCVFIKEPSSVLQSIGEVEYTLHPSFPEPVQVCKDRESCFAIYGTAWGEFRIGVRIFYTDGSTWKGTVQLELRHDRWPTKEFPAGEGGDTKLVYTILRHEKFRWRKFDTVVRKTGLPAATATAILETLRKRNLVRKSPNLSIDQKEMWGVTAVVGVAPTSA